MLDYQLVRAFAVVLDEGGFARASERLCITQSAVSQRVKQLEDSIGKVLIIRESPPRATEAGAHLLRHYRQILELEGETLDAINPRPDGNAPHVSVGVNTDSLFVWFMDAVGPFVKRSGITMEILEDGHERTIEMLRSGSVAGCVSSERSAVEGCVATLIGTLRYALVASSGYMERWFPSGFERSAAARAPIVNLDRNDKMQYRMLFHAFGDPQVAPPAHFVPVADAYYGAIRSGLGYGLVPLLKVAGELGAGRMVELDRGLRIDLTLYWHRWKRRSALLDEMSDIIIAEGGRLLRDETA
ncbi:MAG: LysR family transcriptional regulator ArgP [Spirochaetes bacterium]|nr:LysR family transcriptional regulator ArgP [Spirochaetota bacterium]MBU1079996.1 LysR family transcriptional regulator ArgP [Spirochaetota bacterium]